MVEYPVEIQNFYSSLESIVFEDIWEIYRHLQYTEAIEGLWRNHVITERKALNLTMHDGLLINSAQVTDINGDIAEHSLFSKDELIYLEDRLHVTANFFLKSRYAHILWQETKNNLFAEEAVNAYRNLILTSQHKESYDIILVLKSYIYITERLKKKDSTENRSFILQRINASPNWLKVQILDFTLNEKFF